MFRSHIYYTPERVKEIGVLEQVNMLQKHARRNGINVLKYEIGTGGYVIACTSEYDRLCVACIGKWYDDEEDYEQDWNINR